MSLSIPGVDKVHCMVGATHGFKQVLVITDGDQIIVTDLNGEILPELTRPNPGVKHVGNGNDPTSATKTPNVTEVHRHEPPPMLSRCSEL